MGKRRRLLYADACGLGRRGLRGDERRGGPALRERLGRGACAAGVRSQRAADASRKCCWKAGRDGASAPRMARMRRRARVRGVNVDRPKRSRMAITAWAASSCRGGDDISPPRATRAACMAGERGERGNCDMSSAAPKSDDIERTGETCPHVRRDEAPVHRPRAPRRRAGIAISAQEEGVQSRNSMRRRPPRYARRSRAGAHAARFRRHARDRRFARSALRIAMRAGFS